jgi:hypothetical protein
MDGEAASGVRLEFSLGLDRKGRQAATSISLDINLTWNVSSGTLSNVAALF